MVVVVSDSWFYHWFYIIETVIRLIGWLQGRSQHNVKKLLLTSRSSRLRLQEMFNLYKALGMRTLVFYGGIFAFTEICRCFNYSHKLLLGSKIHWNQNDCYAFNCEK